MAASVPLPRAASFGPACVSSIVGLVCAPNCDGLKRTTSRVGMISQRQCGPTLSIVRVGLAVGLAQTVRPARRISSLLPSRPALCHECSGNAENRGYWLLTSSREMQLRPCCVNTSSRLQVIRGRRLAVSFARQCIQSMSPRRPKIAAANAGWRAAVFAALPPSLRSFGATGRRARRFIEKPRAVLYCSSRVAGI